MKIKSKMHEQKGSVTLFVLISMLTFTIIVSAIYINTSYKAQAQQREVEKIKQTYQKQDINELYQDQK